MTLASCGWRRLLAVAVCVGVTGCTATGVDVGAGDTHGGSAQPTGPSPAATPSTLPATAGSARCVDGPGRAVNLLPDVEVPPVEVPPVTAGAGSAEVAVPGFTIPGQVVDAGCVIRYDAPGGCLGAVEITGATIPAVTIPGSTLPAVELSDDTRSEPLVIEPVTVPAVTVPPVRTPQVCQVEQDGELPAVTRAGVVREGFSRDGASRPGDTRPGVCAGDECVPEIRIDAVAIEPVRLPDVDVDPARLASRDLPGRSDVQVLTGQGRASYVAPAKVLFDSESAAIRPGAAAALRAIARQIERRHPGSRLQVDGHTDDRGDEAYGMRLSVRRARSVARWLTEHAGVARDRITTRGFGETAPVVANDSPAHRQRNRRVVITVLR